MDIRKFLKPKISGDRKTEINGDGIASSSSSSGIGCGLPPSFEIAKKVNTTKSCATINLGSGKIITKL